LGKQIFEIVIGNRKRKKEKNIGIKIREKKIWAMGAYPYVGLWGTVEFQKNYL
jgi:hypothetical protein